MSNRVARIAEIERVIGQRKLIWFGTRGEDASPLLCLRQFSECFSLIAPLGSPAVRDFCLETITGERVDLDHYSPDLDDSAEAGELHRCMSEAVEVPSVMAAYRPTAFATSICFPRSDTVQYLGVFHELQAAFEHKPWMETELRKAGVSVLPWQYFGADDRERLVKRLAKGPQVVRTIRSDGGTGLKVVRAEAELPAGTLADRYGFVAAADYLQPNIPLNVNGVVFPGGSISLHGPSLQLIGIDGLTAMPLGYCGNDFARVKDLESDTMGQLEAIALGAGRWLAAYGYVGAFGVDALESGGEVFLAEVNPRFQGSSSLSADLDRWMDRPDMYLENMAAFLGLEPPPNVPLAILAAEQAAVAHVVPHNCSAVSVRMANPGAFRRNGSTWQLVPAAGIKVPRDAALGRAVFEGVITSDGSQLVGDLGQKLLEQCHSAYAEPTADQPMVS